jgi:hypothetical protein
VNVSAAVPAAGITIHELPTHVVVLASMRTSLALHGSHRVGYTGAATARFPIIATKNAATRQAKMLLRGIAVTIS